MIEWIKQTFYNRPDTRSPVVAKFLNDIQDYMMQLGLIKDYVVDSDVTPTGTWVKMNSGTLIQWRIGSFPAKQSSATRNAMGFYFADFYLPDYAIPFVGTKPTLLVSTSAGTTDHILSNEYESSATGGGQVRLQVASPSISVTAVYNYIAIGRWK